MGRSQPRSPFRKSIPRSWFTAKAKNICSRVILRPTNLKRSIWARGRGGGAPFIPEWYLKNLQKCLLRLLVPHLIFSNQPAIETNSHFQPSTEGVYYRLRKVVLCTAGSLAPLLHHHLIKRNVLSVMKSRKQLVAAGGRAGR